MTLSKTKTPAAATAATEAEAAIEPAAADRVDFECLADEWEAETAPLSSSDQAT